VEFEIWSALDHLSAMQLECSFCRKTQSEVRTLIAGPGVFICDDCTAICADVIGTSDKGWRERQIASLIRLRQQAGPPAASDRSSNAPA
jgi:hypothetical protein